MFMMNKMHLGSITLVSLLTGLSLIGCATTSNVSPLYVSPNTYQNYDCDALSQELDRINTYIEHTDKQYSRYTSTGVGVGVVAGNWGVSPNISFGVGESSDNQLRDIELSRLYGQSDAVIQSARLKHCPFAKGMKIYGE